MEENKRTHIKEKKHVNVKINHKFLMPEVVLLSKGCMVHLEAQIEGWAKSLICALSPCFS